MRSDLNANRPRFARRHVRAAALGLILCACTPAIDTAPADAAPTRGQSLRAELEKAYDANRRAMVARDLDAVMALRAPDFHAVTPDGAVHGPEEMLGAARHLLTNVQKWEALSFDILSVEQSGEEVVADIRQHSIRIQQRDGAIRRIENWVTQRETWVRTGTGLKLRRVDNIRDQTVLIDGKRRA